MQAVNDKAIGGVSEKVEESIKPEWQKPVKQECEQQTQHAQEPASRCIFGAEGASQQ